ncbi:NUDIX hydrolase [Congregibacter sp.]|uniref:NUDIX hydrolase n=1 Tax=Congregibacter sp. TaxID=2744308 RepID=UPI003F6B5D99
MTVPIRPASTVVLLRDGEEGLELLMVRRNRALAFAGGFWVFPGGAVDDADRAQCGDDPDEAARYAAAREAEEEAGVSPDPAAMVLISHWTTPVGERKRFSTWIFAGEVAADAEVVIDGSEIHEYQWIGVTRALDLHRAGELPMMPPTYITLCAMARYETASDALAGERETPCPRVLPLLVPVEGEGKFATLYPGDVGYENGDMDADGPKHRAFLSNGSWQYQYQGVSEPPLYPQD